MRRTWTLLGLVLLSVPSLGDLRPRFGDLLVLASAVGWAAQAVAVERFARHHSSLLLSAAQMLTATILHLAVATPGRGFWILDDLTPIQQMTPRVRQANAHLFTPRPTYRFRPVTVPVTMSDDPSAGQNAPYGAAISYHLKSVPSGDVRIRIEDSKGVTVAKRPCYTRICRNFEVVKNYNWP